MEMFEVKTAQTGSEDPCWRQWNFINLNHHCCSQQTIFAMSCLIDKGMLITKFQLPMLPEVVIGQNMRPLY
jgi:hypothetical protein